MPPELFDYSEDVGLSYDYHFFAVDFKLAARVLAVKHRIADLDLHSHVLAVHRASGTYRHNRGELGFFLGGAR